MPIVDKLSTSLGRADEGPNIALAEQISKRKDTKAIDELIALLDHKDKKIQGNSIKVLYEIGERKPELIADHVKSFLALLDNKNNRLVWGAMTALDTISAIKPKEIYRKLSVILEIAAKGSVITRDHAVNILINLAKEKIYAKDAQTLLFAEILSSPVNQLPMYAERAAPIVTKDMEQKFVKTLQSRLDDVEQDSKRKRIQKVLRKFGA